METPTEETPVDDTLTSALARYDISLAEDQIAPIAKYCERLWDWNTRINLTRHTTWDKFVSRDLIDALAFEPFLEPGARVLDVGTGGGVPGAILAIMRPDLEISMCDSVTKKAKAAAAIVEEAEIDATVIHGRAEEILQKQDFDVLVVRAVAPLRKMLTWFEPHWSAMGQLLVLKGPKWVEERGEARHHGLLSGIELRKLASYPLAGTDSESVLLRMRPEA